jgi:hypothetical protein
MRVEKKTPVLLIPSERQWKTRGQGENKTGEILSSVGKAKNKTLVHYIISLCNSYSIKTYNDNKIIIKS